MNTRFVMADTTKNDNGFPEPINVLVVDSDSTCLTIVSKMLCASGYKVVTAQSAAEALAIVTNRQHELHVVLTEVCFPDMDKYELLEKMGQVSKLPIVIMSADDTENAILGGLFKGAMLYFVKPVTMNNIRNLWQFSFMKKQDRATAEPSEQNELNDTDLDVYRNAKRKELEKTDTESEDENDETAIVKKPKLVWTKQLHNRFLQAITVLGHDKSHPKEILQHMNVPGLTKENVSSHLQKYRLALKRGKAGKEGKRKLRKDSTISLAPTNLQEEFVEFLNQKYTKKSHFPNHGSDLQDNVSNITSIPKFRRHLDSVFQAVSYNNHPQPTNKPYSTNASTNHVGISLNGNEKGTGFAHIARLDGERNLDVNISRCYSGCSCYESETPSPTLQVNSLQQQQQQQQEFDELLDIAEECTMVFDDDVFDDLLG